MAKEGGNGREWSYVNERNFFRRKYSQTSLSEFTSFQSVKKARYEKQFLSSSFSLSLDKGNSKIDPCKGTYRSRQGENTALGTLYVVFFLWELRVRVVCIFEGVC